MARFCAEVGPLVVAGRFLTGPDMGTAEEDFAPLRERRAAPAAMGAVVDGVPFEDVLTGGGVAALRTRCGRVGFHLSRPLRSPSRVPAAGRRRGGGVRSPPGRPGRRSLHRRQVRR